MKKIMCFICIVAIVLSVSNIGFSQNIDTQNLVNISFNGKPLQTELDPIVQNDRIFVPLRSVLEKIGGYVQWIGSSQKVIVNYKSNTIIK